MIENIYEQAMLHFWLWCSNYRMTILDDKSTHLLHYMMYNYTYGLYTQDFFYDRIEFSTNKCIQFNNNV